ncbi:MAG: YgiQ family radical SAM protein [Bacteroidales bacterium]|nr:YgiQ family radical SAM protein [Bacteroidales bacterium]
MDKSGFSDTQHTTSKLPCAGTYAHFLPITADEVKRLGWDMVDIVIVSGDCYIDHPSFGTAVIGRVLEAEGYRVAIIPQPNWRDDLRDFRKFGKPRLFFGVTSGVMDSMVNHYTAARRLRHDDAYTPGGQSGFRPDYATYVYSKILKQQYPDTPVIIGGIEASMRRLAHYDYWADELKPSILVDCPADLLVYGMAERTMIKIAQALDRGESVDSLRTLPQVAYRCHNNEVPQDAVILHSYDDCLKSKRLEAENFHVIESESNKIDQRILAQGYTPPRLEERGQGGEASQSFVVVNPPEPPMTTDELDHSFDLPYLRAPHPKYKKRGTVPAYEMIKNSVNIHRGCFGGCSFCTISAHQGKQVVSRSERSIMEEVNTLVADPSFNGVLSDLGGPSANMYGMHGRNTDLCRRCTRYSCIHPTRCRNLMSDHRPLIDLYRKVSSVKGVKHLYIGSGIRCDLFYDDNHGFDYFREVVLHHVSGRLKVAPEHTSIRVLDIMRKPSFDLFLRTKQDFDRICASAGLRYQLIPYFISSHPGCTVGDMADLAVFMKKLGYRLEQIQDFTPTPMTLSTEMYYTGINPDTMEPVFVETDPIRKKEQNLMFFAYKPENRAKIRQILQRSHNEKYIRQLCDQIKPSRR